MNPRPHASAPVAASVSSSSADDPRVLSGDDATPTRLSGESKLRLVSLLGPCAPAILALLAVLSIAGGLHGPLRGLLVAGALLIAPGYALLPTVGRIDPWAKAGVVVGVSLTVETLLSLVMVWSGFWHPVEVGTVVLLISGAVVVVREVRRAMALTPALSVHVDDVVVGEPLTRQVPAESAGARLRPGWQARLDDGRLLDVSGLILIGREPAAPDGEKPTLITIDDTTRTVSKTHLGIGINANGMYMMDCGSTNGSTVTRSDGVIVRPAPDEMISVDVGNIVSFGAHWLEVRREPPA